MNKDFCLTTSSIWRVIGYVIFIVKILVPLIIIIMGTIDLAKCVVSGKDDEIKASFKKLLTKVIIGIVIFLIPTITRMVFSVVKEASESMIYAEGCLTCLLNPKSETCSKAVTTAEEARKSRNAELYNKFYEDLNGDKIEPVDISGNNPDSNQNNPTNPATTPDPTPNDPNPNPSQSNAPTEMGVNKFSFTASTGIDMNYWVVTPSNVHSGMPLIVFLHGGGNDYTSGQDKTQVFNKLVTSDHPFVDVKRIYGDNFPFILLIPHNYNSWVATGHQELYELIIKVADMYYINPNKISITGVSNGALGTWSFVSRYPDLISAAYIISGPPYTNGYFNIDNLKNEKIKGMSETNNGYYAAMDYYCQKVNELGGNGICEITSKPNMTHDTILTVAYSKETFDWLISQ